MDRSRPRTSRPRRRLEPLIAKPRPQDSESDTATEADAVKIVRPKTAFVKPSTSSRNCSGVRGEEKFLSARSSSGNETDTETIKPISPHELFPKYAPRRSSSGVRVVQAEEKYYSSFDSTGTETDTETLKAFSPKQFNSTPEPAEYTNEIVSPDEEAEYSSDFESDGAETVITVPQKQKYSLPVPPMSFSDERSVDSEGGYSPTAESDDAETVVSVAPKQKRPLSVERSQTCLKDELQKVPILNLDDLDSVSGKSSVMLKSTHGYTDLKLKNHKGRDSSGSRLADQLKKIDSKNMLFFPSKNLTRMSVENIYGPATNKRSSSKLRQSTESLKSTSNVSNDKIIPPKTPLEKDTPRPAAAKKVDKPLEPTVKKNEPKILAPLMVKGRLDKKTEKNRPTGPVKPKPFMASGCGKGIPPLENLPKPKIGRLPAFLLNRKKEAEESSLKSGSLNTLENKEIKPAIPNPTPRSSRPSEDLFTRNRIPLRKRGSQSTSNLISSMASPKIGTNELKPKKSVTFDLPDAESTAEEEAEEEEAAVEEEDEEIPKGPNTTYIDPLRRKFKKYFEKLPTFDEGPLPITEPSPLYQRIKNIGWDYSRFTPKKSRYPVPTIPYNFLDQYLHIFENNLERAAVHMKYGSVTVCTCDQSGDGSDFCEKHVDPTRLQYYQEVAEVMTFILSVRYEVPHYDKAEKMLEENYPFIYHGCILNKPNRLSMDYRVREVRCKAELVASCRRVLEEEELLAEFTQSEEIIGKKRDIRISGRMKDVDEDFELSYTFLFMEYPYLFIQLVQQIEFMPLAIERKIIGTRRQQIVDKANLPDDKLQEQEELYRAKLQGDE
ncbi:uncharacterized protein LOC123321483 isoform X1 [Coccinella septempunctata]|uniref:uncharacterized protein LOC123321483 isoform X1 n=1 Tax=Coccinella septempunctata TaxID=41139 RepID=UPI001D076F6C|nr:uncharacterized protein LOC123321483 isoform X1 [Coccinella septempunctata]XP_044765053.1 uncharacterized protein LOC123321483 isoform X1 [Coccinella septempunctata]